MSLLSAASQLPSNAPALTSASTIASANHLNNLTVSVNTSMSTVDDKIPNAIRPGYQILIQSEPEGPSWSPSFSFTVDETFSEGEADKLVDVYRNDLAIQAPFVIVPADLTAFKLKQERPFLFHCILMIASYKDVSRQQLLQREIMKCLSTNLILNGERNFDLLQGLLIYVTWYVAQIFPLAIGFTRFLFAPAISRVCPS